MTNAAQQTVTELLHQQHEQVKEMFAQLAVSHGLARDELFDCLRATLAVHETAEEIVVYPVARRAGGDAERVVDARLAEEDHAKQVLADLEKIGPGGDGFDAMFGTFRQAVIAHAEAEEAQLFPILERSSDRADLEKMAERIRSTEDMAPTHPHPHAPNSAVGNLALGPFAAMVDKVRDRLHSRAA